MDEGFPNSEEFYSLQDLEKFDRAELRAMEDNLEAESRKMSGTGPGKERSARRTIHELFWKDESFDDLLSGTTLEAVKVNAPGHYISDINGTLKSYTENMDYTLKFEYECNEGKIKFEPVYADQEKDYRLEPGIRNREGLLEEVADKFESRIFWKNRIID